MDNYLFISDAAKEVKVESHVLRYWEEELHLPIKRNELGHRYYTEEDVERFKQIKGMKERGLQLKAGGRGKERSSGEERSGGGWPECCPGCKKHNPGHDVGKYANRHCGKQAYGSIHTGQ